LDPEAIIGQQPALAFSCGVDALSHGLESLVSKESNALSRMMSRECIRLIVENLGPFTDEPTLDRAAKLQIGALLGGVALKHARLGYAHALGHALAAYRHIPHGESIARVLPAVMKFNQDCATSQYQTVARHFCSSKDVGPDRIIADYLSKCGLPIGITDLNLSTEEIQAIAARCAAGPFHRWNPRPAEEDDFITLLNQMNT
jgi:alcohol dehydrogenase class IV